MMKATIDEQLRGMIVSFTHKEIFWKRKSNKINIKSCLKTWIIEMQYFIMHLQFFNLRFYYLYHCV
jgi:hypothetical protein